MTSGYRSSDTFIAGQAWKTAILLAVFMLINFLDKIVLGLVAVPMMDELQITPQEMGFIASSFFWLFAVAGILGGFLANRFSTKFLILGMVLVWSICQWPVAVSASVGAIIACRVLLGIGEGPAWPVAVHALYKWFPHEKRNLPVAIVAQGSAVGLILAGILIPLITAHWGWRGNFVVLGAIGCVWALLWFCLAEEGSLDTNTTVDPASARSEMLPYARLLLDRTVLGCIITHFVGYWSLALGLTWLPAYFQRGLGYDGIESGRLYALVVVFSIPMGIGLAWWSQRLLERGMSSKAARGRFLCVSLTLAGVLLTLLAVAPSADWMRVALIAVALGCTPIVYSLGPALIAEVVPPSQRGAVLAIDNSVASTAGIVAPIMTGMLIQGMPGASGYEIGFVLCGGLMAVGGCLGFFMIDPARSVRLLRTAEPAVAQAIPAK